VTAIVVSLAVLYAAGLSALVLHLLGVFR